MGRTSLRVIVILLLLLVAVVAPVLVEGYSELNKAAASDSYPAIAEHYLRAAQRLPWRADLYELAGHAFFHAGEYARADEVYRSAFEKNVLTPEGWAAWGDVNYLNDNPTQAVEIWNRGLQQKEFSDGLYQRLAYAFQEQGDFPKAADYLQIYAAHRPEDASAHYQLGLLLTLSDPLSALTELITASQLDPQFDSPAQTLRSALNLALLNDLPSERFVIIGSGLGLVNVWQLARAAFESAVQADESNAEAWAWLGEAKQQNGEEGSVELDRALELNPNSPIVRGLRGLYFQRTGNFPQALIEYQTAATLDPQDPERFFSLGDAFALNGDLIRALESFQYAVTLAPNDAATWRALAEFCGRHGIHLNDIGIPAAQRAVTIAPNDSLAEATLGWLWYLNGDAVSAERHLLRALELDSQNTRAYLHMGVLYLQSNDRTRAFDHLTRARDLGSSEADALLKQYFP